jgi:uncharacterized protein (TIGR00304 family)
VADASALFSLGFALIIVGVLIFVAAGILFVVLGGRRRNVKTAGVTIVGPIPIIFGSDKKAVKTLSVLAVTLTVLLIAGMLIYYFLLLR